MNADEIRQRAGDLAALAAATELIERKAGRGSTPACIVLSAVRVFFDEVNGLDGGGEGEAPPAPKARRGRPPKANGGNESPASLSPSAEQPSSSTTPSAPSPGEGGAP